MARRSSWVEVAGAGDDRGAAVVVAAQETEELRALEGGDGFEAAGERAAQRMGGPHRLREEFLRVLRGLVWYMRISSRMTSRSRSMSSGAKREARYMSHSTSQSFGRCARGLGVVAGVILGREGVEVTADALDRLGESAGRCVGPVPLKSMCSRKCETPLSGAASCRPPTPTQIPTLALCMCGMCAEATRMPLGRRLRR